MSKNVRIAFAAIVAIAMGTTSSLMAADSAVKPDPYHLPLISHQTLTFGGKVIYQKDFDLGDPNNVGLNVAIAVDQWQKWDATLLGSLSTTRVGNDENGNFLKGIMVSYVVTNIDRDGNANVLIAYTVRDPDTHVDKSGVVTSKVRLGEPHVETAKDGTKISITVVKQK